MVLLKPHGEVRFGFGVRNNNTGNLQSDTYVSTVLDILILNSASEYKSVLPIWYS